MKALVVLLSFCAAGFVASTFYLAGKLHEVRSASIASGAGQDESAVAPQPTSSAARSVVRADDAALARPLDASGTRPAAPEGQQLNPAQRESAAFMKRYEDPQQRAEMLANEKTAQLRAMRKFGELADLSDDEMDQLLTLLAQNELEGRAWRQACRLDNQCDRGDSSFPDADRQEAAVAAYLGPERYQRYRDFRDSRPERGLVSRLRERVLSSSALRDADAEKLISAMLDERRQYISDMEKRGEPFSMRVTSLGVVITRGGADGSPQDSAQALDFHSRLNARVSRILTPEQFIEFMEVQELAIQSSQSPRNVLNNPEATPNSGARSD